MSTCQGGLSLRSGGRLAEVDDEAEFFGVAHDVLPECPCDAVLVATGDDKHKFAVVIVLLLRAVTHELIVGQCDGPSVRCELYSAADGGDDVRVAVDSWNGSGHDVVWFEWCGPYGLGRKFHQSTVSISLVCL